MPTIHFGQAAHGYHTTARSDHCPGHAFKPLETIGVCLMSSSRSVQQTVYDALGLMGLKYAIDPSDPVTYVGFAAEDGQPRVSFTLVAHEDAQVVEIAAPDLGAISPANRQSVLEEINLVQSWRALPAVKWLIDSDGDLCAATALDIEHSSNPAVAIAICFTGLHRQVRDALPRILAAARQTPEQRELAAVVNRQLSEILGNPGDHM